MDSPPQVATRSFQNEPLPDMPPQRLGLKRGIAVLLGDVTNTVLHWAICSVDALFSFLAAALVTRAGVALPGSARGACLARYLVSLAEAFSEQALFCFSGRTLCRLIKSRPDVVNCGGECVSGFLEKKTQHLKRRKLLLCTYSLRQSELTVQAS